MTNRRSAQPRSAIRAAVMWFLMLSTAGSIAQTSSDLDDIEKLLSPEAIEQRVQAALQPILDAEAENQALNELLGQQYDQLQDERARNARLEAKLNAMLGEQPAAAAPGSTEPTAPPQGMAWLTVPPRRVGALGLIEATGDEVATLPPGTESIAVVLPSVDPPDGVAAPRVQIDGRLTRIVLPTPLGDPVTLATLHADGTTVRWRWHAISPGDLNAELRFLDQVLPRATYEARRAGVVLQRYQSRPIEIAVVPDPTRGHRVTLRPGLGAFQLRAERAPAGWVLLDASSAEVAWVSLHHHVAAEVGSDGQSLVVRGGPGVLGRLRAIHRERDEWNRDLNRPPTEGATPIDRDRIHTEIERLDAAEENLVVVRDQLEAATAPVDGSPAGPVSGLNVRVPSLALIDPATGVVLARLNLEGATR